MAENCREVVLAEGWVLFPLSVGAAPCPVWSCSDAAGGTLLLALLWALRISAELGDLGIPALGEDP